jgi:D-3-phosphoglycerate dehydrogenase / 2-oxoglutarate reductase
VPDGGSRRRRVLIADEIDPAETARLASAAELVRPADGSAAALVAAIGDADAIVVRTTPVPAELLAAAPRLRVVAKHGVGVDAIDLAAATARGVIVSYGPGVNAPAVAESALTAILTLLKPARAGAAWLRAGVPADTNLVVAASRAGLVGREVASVRVGILGWGQIGRRVGGAVLALGGNVVAHDPAVAIDASEYPGIEVAADLDDLLAVADVLSLHIPLTAATRHLIGARELAKLPPGAALVNTARGGIVDEAALAASVRDGHLAGAAIDVFETEPPPPDHPLLTLDAVLCTPHVAGSSAETLRRMAANAVDSVLAVLDGGIPPAVANPEVLSR